MKKMLYVSLVDYNSHAELGVIKKIEGQKRAFRNNGFDILHLRIDSGCVFIGENKILQIKTNYDFFIRLPFSLYRYFKNKNLFFDLTYIRNHYFTPFYYKFFKTLKSISSDLVVEIPTYPYSEETTKSIRGSFIMMLDKWNDKLVRRYIDRIITSQNYDRIKGIRTIKIRNGYDFSLPKEIKRQKAIVKLKLISVANFNFWHGIDRLLYGLLNYSNSLEKDKLDIELHLVGAGMELPKLRALAENLQLKNVIFHGPKSGDELDEIYRQSHIGIGALGLYRRNLDFLSSLKNMEHCFYGMPFIIGHPDKDIDGLPFVLEVPNDASPIDLVKVVRWYNNLDIDEVMIQKIGYDLYDWNKQIEIILAALKLEKTVV